MKFLFKIWNFLVSMAHWSFSHKHAFLYIVFGAIITFLSWKNHRNVVTIDETNPNNKNIPADVNSVLKTENGKVKVAFRDKKTGEVKVVEKYIPPEGSIENISYQVTHKENNSLLNRILGNKISDFLIGPTIVTSNGTIRIKDRGFCLKPGFFIACNNKFTQGLDLKLFYLNRYSLGIGTGLNLDNGLEYGDLFFSRHLDDLIPFINPKNVEAFVGYGRKYSELEKSELLFGLRTNF